VQAANFPDIEPFIQNLSPYEQDFARLEFGRGLDYYLARLEQLSFSGEHVLDAGCGQGQWALALARRFRKVDALDLNPERLALLAALQKAMGLDNITPRPGSIEELPYADNTYDAVFCYGVIMFTNLPRVLAEFHRVLKPGGRVYVCLNADGWNHYLLEERGKDNPALREQARQILYSTYWMRHGRQLAEAYRNESPTSPNWMRLLYRALPRRLLLKLYPPAAYPSRKLFLALGGNIERQLGRDIGRLVRGASPEALPLSKSRAYMPADMVPQLEAAGFTNFCWGHEGRLLFALEHKAPPIYDSYYKGRLNVWEFCAVKPPPTTASALSVLEYVAQHNGVFPPLNMTTPFFIHTPSYYPPHLARHWQSAAKQLGGQEFLARLTAELTQGAVSENERFARLVHFVQRSIFRDPLCQPLNDEGDPPEPLAILLSGRGRCGHCALLLGELLRLAGFPTELIQLPRHVSLTALVEGRWVLAEADAFKNGVIPHNKAGLPLGLEDIENDPLQLDCFPATGWRFQADSRHVIGPRGERYGGYVEAVDWHIRGYVSGYYRPEVAAAPPQIPAITGFTRKNGEIVLEWSASRAESDPLLHYEIFVGTYSRQWQYDDTDDAVLSPLPGDVLQAATTDTRYAFAHSALPLYASIRAIGKRRLENRDIYFWPSKEACLAE